MVFDQIIQPKKLPNRTQDQRTCIPVSHNKWDILNVPGSWKDCSRFICARTVTLDIHSGEKYKSFCVFRICTESHIRSSEPVFGIPNEEMVALKRDVYFGVRPTNGPCVPICHPEYCVPNMYIPTKFAVSLALRGLRSWLKQSRFLPLREARDSKSLDHHGVTPVTGCFSHTASIGEPGFSRHSAAADTRVQGTSSHRRPDKASMGVKLLPGSSIANPRSMCLIMGAMTEALSLFEQTSRVATGACTTLFSLAVLPDDVAYMVNPFPPVLAANAPHGLIDALDAHTHKHGPTPLPLDPGHVLHLRLGGGLVLRPTVHCVAVAIGLALARVQASASDPRWRARADAGIRAWDLAPAGGQGWSEEGQAKRECECEELLLSPEGISDGTTRRSRGTPPVVWREGGPEAGRNRSLSGTAMLRGAKQSPLLHLVPPLTPGLHVPCRACTLL
ncbi:hypothetical protein DFH07DRAFT_769845 [Mycena maculata]|uniref:Uncharacterized protein n=1 Tax=Mycena maculata TaxID=230809 RepID=A0AAD7JMY6_9AGAR|nr:hypothetical protein DFH07DRAFT_769845 [Mycena maculata]